MLFREVPGAVVAELRAHRWLDGREVTVVRALDGTVRVCVQGPPPRPAPGQVAELEAALRARIGAWLGDAEPVWSPPRRGHDALVDAIHAARRPWPVEPAPPFALYRLERHSARHGWVGELEHRPPWTLEEADAGTRPPIVTFFSHKGGVGRTTALAAVAIAVAEAGRKVLALDLDLEAPGLGTLLADPAPSEPGILDLLVGPESVADVHVGAVAAPHADALGVTPGTVLVAKAGEVDEGYLDLLARVDLHGHRDAAVVTERLRRVIRALADLHRPDLVLLDARAGFHDVGGVALGALSHGAVFLGLSNEQSWQGLREVARTLSSAGYDDDGDPRVWLQVVHALAAPGGDPLGEAAFRQRAADVLAEHYHLQGHVPQDLSVVVLPFREALRGAGDRLAPRHVAALRERPWRDLAATVTDRYAALSTDRA